MANLADDPFFSPETLKVGRGSAAPAAQPRSLTDDPFFSPETLKKPMAAPAGQAGAPPAETAPAAPRMTPEQNQADLKQYENMPFSEVGSRALKAAPGSAMNVFRDVGHAVTHLPETASAIGELGKGIYSKGMGAFGVEQDPEEKARTESLLDAVIAQKKGQYESIPAFKRTLATDPFAVGMDIATPLTLGEAAIPSGLKTAGMIGKASTLARGASALMDPIQGSIEAAKLVGKPAGAALRMAQEVSTGIPQPLLKAAQAAGATQDPALKAAFLRHMSGQSDPLEIAKVAQDAIGDIRSQTSAGYLQSKDGLIANQTPLPFDRFDNTINELRQHLQMTGPGTTAFPEANQMLQRAEALIDEYRRHPDPSRQSLEGLDNLKRALWDLSQSSGNREAETVANRLREAAKQTIMDRSPEYGRVMDAYGDMQDEIRTLTKQFGAGKNANMASTIAKMMKNFKNPTGGRLFDRLAETPSGRQLPYMLAGAAMHPYLPGGMRNIVEYAMAYPSFLQNPGYPLATFAASSPRIQGNLQYALGKASGTVPRIADRISPLGYQAEQAREERGHADGGRAAYRSGGRILDHGSKADALVRAAESARKAISGTTEPLLDMPDEHVVKALAVAGEAI